MKEEELYRKKSLKKKNQKSAILLIKYKRTSECVYKGRSNKG